MIKKARLNFLRIMELFSFSISRIMFGKLTFFSSYFSFKNIRGNLGPVSPVSSSVNFRGQRTDLASQFSCGINLYLLRQRTTFFCHVGDGIWKKNGILFSFMFGSINLVSSCFCSDTNKLFFTEKLIRTSKSFFLVVDIYFYPIF